MGDWMAWRRGEAPPHHGVGGVNLSWGRTSFSWKLRLRTGMRLLCTEGCLMNTGELSYFHSGHGHLLRHAPWSHPRAESVTAPSRSGKAV